MRLFFQGDLFYAPDHVPVSPALAVSEALARAIVAAGIEVDTIMGIHGRPVKWGEFEVYLTGILTAAW